MDNTGGGKAAAAGVGNGVRMSNIELENNPYIRVGRTRLKVSVVSAVGKMGVGKKEWSWYKRKEKNGIITWVESIISQSIGTEHR